MYTIKIGGGLGNQIFYYAFYKKLKNLGYEVYVDISEMELYNLHNGYELEQVFRLDILKIPQEQKIKELTLIERKFLNRIYIKLKKIIYILSKRVYIEKWGEISFPKHNKKNKNIYCLGAFQSEKYFYDIRDIIRQELEFPIIKDELNKKIEKEIRNSNSVSIHIRRGDYLNDKGLGGLAPLKYYQNAIEYIKSKINNPCFFIFSNDIEWCKQNLDLENCYYIDWNKGKESYRDMQLMSLCKHNIIPNSSFSWWGAWLNNNPDKIVIAPEKWFNDCVKMDYSNVVPETWIKIKNY